MTVNKDKGRIGAAAPPSNGGGAEPVAKARPRPSKAARILGAFAAASRSEDRAKDKRGSGSPKGPASWPTPDLGARKQPDAPGASAPSQSPGAPAPAAAPDGPPLDAAADPATDAAADATARDAGHAPAVP